MFNKTFGDVKHGSIAFIPETLRLIGDPRLQPETIAISGMSLHFQGKNDVSYGILAYWHEISKKKHLVVFGVIHVTFSAADLESKNINPLELNYDQFLQHSCDFNSTYGKEAALYRDSLHKVGNTCPYNSQNSFFPDAEVHYDAEALNALLTHPNIYPTATDGWFKWSPKNSEGQLLPSPT